MKTQDQIGEINQKLDDLLENIKQLSEKQNSQYTDIMVKFNELLERKEQVTV